MTVFYDPHNPARIPTWRKAGRDEGFRIVGERGRQWDIRRLSRHVGEVRVSKAGWIRFRWSRAASEGVKSYRVTMDRAGRWHVAFAAIPEPVPAPGNGQVVGVDREFDVIRVENLNIAGMTRSARGSTAGPGRNVAQKAGLNRGIMRSGWGLLVRRLQDKAPGRVEKVSPVYTSQRCSACGHVAAESRKSQALFACVACNFACNADVNADVNAARNIAAGHG